MLVILKARLFCLSRKTDRCFLPNVVPSLGAEVGNAFTYCLRKRAWKLNKGVSGLASPSHAAFSGQSSILRFSLYALSSNSADKIN